MLNLNRKSMLNDLAARRFDLLVVGGGITGAGVAREASLRGLQVALVEQFDFAYGTSSRSTKLIHGGLRYLKQFDFKLVREAVEERQRLIQMAPHLVKVTPFVFPVYRGDSDSLLKLRVGLFIYDWFARMRAAVPHKMLSPGALLELEPGLRDDGLLGGAVYTDCRTDDGRLSLVVLQSAAGHGAVVANYAGVQSFFRGAGGRLEGAVVRDTLTGDLLEVRAARILAAAGPWADEIRRLDDPEASPVLRLTKGVHLAVPRERLPLGNAVVIRGRDQRIMFAVPLVEYSYIGTTDTDFSGRPSQVRGERDDVDYILDATNHAFPESRLTLADVTSLWVGLRPLLRPVGDASPSATTRDYALFQSQSGLVNVGGGKLSAFRAMASHIVDVLFPNTRSAANLTASASPLPGADGPLPGQAEWQRLAAQTGATTQQVEKWCARYGSALKQVVQYLPAKPDPDPALTWHRAMTLHAVQHEMAQRLEDVLSRRTDLLLFTDDNGRHYLQALAREMGSALGWSNDRLREEVAGCEKAIDQRKYL